MKYVRAFISGLVLPSVLIPFMLCFADSMGKTQLLTIPFIHFIPILWGIWNVLYFAFFKNVLPKEVNIRLLATGAALGLLVALIGVFWYDLPAVAGFPQYRFLPLVAVPIVYAILWWLAVKPLNHLLGINEE